MPPARGCQQQRAEISNAKPKLDGVLELKTYLTRHGLRVDLTHVKSAVISLHHINRQSPGIVAIVTHTHTRVVGHHVGMNGQNGLGIRAEPGNLKKSLSYFTKTNFLSRNDQEFDVRKM